MRKLKAIACFLLFPLTTNAQMNMDSIRQSVKYLEEGLQTKKVSVSQQGFAPDFSISTYTLPSAAGLLGTIMQGMTFESVQLDSKADHTAGDTTYVYARFTLPEGKEEKSVIAFNSSNKILFIDYFDRLFGHSRYWKSSLAVTIPFQLNGNSIILSARLNDSSRTLSFLLDTGADGMAIRKSVAEEIGLQANRTQNASVVGGQATVQISGGNVVHLSDSLAMNRQNIAIFEKVREGIDGIIGLNLVKQYITKVDFDTQTISLYTFGTYDFPDEGYVIPVRISGSLVMLPSELNLTGNKSITGNFIMDTGANYYLIAFSQFVRKNRLLLSGFKPEGNGTTVSLGHVTPVYYGHAHSLKVGDIMQENIPVTLQASTGNDVSPNTGVDGSVGIQFFNNYNFTVDLLRKTIHLHPRQSKE